MTRKILTTVTLIVLSLTTLFLVIYSDRSQLAVAQGADRLTQPSPLLVKPIQPQPESIASTACAIQPDTGPARARTQAALARRARLLVNYIAPLTRFRQDTPLNDAQGTTASDAAKAIDRALPREDIALIDPTNYGERFLRDVNGDPADLDPIVVLHETVGSADSAISFFQTFHSNDDDQASYHTLVRRNGTIVYLVPPEKRAFGAGNSVFVGPNGPEAVKTNPTFPPSVNNFAYHISLETPPDGNNNGYAHSGYTDAQYQSLAWLVAKTGIDTTRITTHKAVDRSRSRIDPRSFNNGKFLALLQTYPRTSDIMIRCTPPETFAPASPQ